VLALALVLLQGGAGGGRVTLALLGIAALVAAIVVFALVLRSEELARRFGLLAGRVASRLLGLIRRPAVFFCLRELRRGDAVRVGRADGSVLRFTVERTGQYPKDRFPTDDVYYPTLTPGLRLVTCGGTFDATWGHYRSNIIVFADVRP
jgi:hypothetical protein